MVRSRYARGAVEVFAPGEVEVRFRYAYRCGSSRALTFYLTVYTVIVAGPVNLAVYSFSTALSVSGVLQT